MDEITREKLGVHENKPNDWFETLYSTTNERGEGIPWASMKPHPLFKDWINRNPDIGKGKTALVIGCGMGDDAIELDSQGFNVDSIRRFK